MMRRRLLLYDSIPYTPLEYLGCSETQYINTNFLLNKNDKITLKFWLAPGGGKTEVIWGFRWNGISSGTQHGYITNTSSGYRRIVLGVPSTTQGVGSDACFPFNTIVNLVIDTKDNSVTINDENVPFNFNLSNGRFFNSSGSSQYSPLLFSFNNKGNHSLVNIPVNARIYDYIVERNNDEVQHLIPCLRNIDNVPCFYDLVTKSFFTNQGTGDFITP